MSDELTLEEDWLRDTPEVPGPLLKFLQERFGEPVVVPGLPLDSIMYHAGQANVVAVLRQLSQLRELLLSGLTLEEAEEKVRTS